METLKEQAAALLQECEIVNLASIDENGYPRPVPLSKLKAESITSIWTSTGVTSEKTKHFKKNPKAGISFNKDGDSVALTGEVTIETNPEVKKEIWSDWMLAHFPGGPEDPNYCVLRFDAQEATYFIKGTFVHKTL